MQVLATFLPQFHPCPYNEEWWGKGFTEWSNVVNAKPLFKGHKQPVYPLNGFEFLNHPSDLEYQFKIAEKYGISGFSIYHYWSLGKRLLSKPLDLIINNPSLEIQYSLCWANHPWTRSWRNRSGSLDILLNQDYENPSLNPNPHWIFLEKCFLDDRYIRYLGKPFFQIYDPEAIPQTVLAINSLRDHFRLRHNLELHISAYITSPHFDPSHLPCFDSFSLFQPAYSIASYQAQTASRLSKYKARIRNKILTLPIWARSIAFAIQDLTPFSSPRILDFSAISMQSISDIFATVTLFSKQNTCLLPMAFVGFDNTPRYKGRATILKDATPPDFANQIKALLDFSSTSQILILNSWNEWGEGMHLMPDTQFQYRFLEVLLSSLSH